MFDALQACQFNYPAVFGCPYIELPLRVVEDIKALLKRQGQLEAKT